MPDLGAFVLGPSLFSLDFRMGNDWNAEAVLGLFSIMAELKELAPHVTVSDNGGRPELNNSVLMAKFNEWCAANHSL